MECYCLKIVRLHFLIRNRASKAGFQRKIKCNRLITCHLQRLDRNRATAIGQIREGGFCTHVRHIRQSFGCTGAVSGALRKSRALYNPPHSP